MSRIDAVGIAAQSGSGTGGMGTSEETMEYFPPVESGSPDPDMTEMNADETVGSRFPSARELGSVYFKPTFKGKIRPNWLPRLLSSYLGDPVTSVVTAAHVWKHTFDPTLDAAIPRALSILMHRGDPEPGITDLFWDCLGNDLELSTDVDDWLMFDAAFVARALDDTQDPPDVVQDITRRFSFLTTTAHISVAGGSETAVAVSNFSAAWSGNIDTDNKQLGSRDLYRVVPGNVDLEVKFTPLQDLADYYRRALMVEPETVKLRLLAQGPIIYGSNHQEVEIIAYKLTETDAAADVSAGDTLKGIEITASASLSDAGKFFDVAVTNGVATYAVA